MTCCATGNGYSPPPMSRNGRKPKPCLGGGDQPDPPADPRINGGLDQLTSDERAQTDRAVAAVRRHRAIMLGMPRIRPAAPELRPENTA